MLSFFTRIWYWFISLFIKKIYPSELYVLEASWTNGSFGKSKKIIEEGFYDSNLALQAASDRQAHPQGLEAGYKNFQVIPVKITLVDQVYKK